MRLIKMFALAAAVLVLHVNLVNAQAGNAATSATATTGGTTAVAAPEVGDVAPDFTLPWADASGTRPEPVRLSDLKGKVVVIAFYPADRTNGCTAEMTKFRDEYKTIFGDDVVVLPISGDGLESHASWAKDMNLPFALVSDVGLRVATQYGSAGPRTAQRNTFVIGKDGKVAWRQIRFNALTEESYTTLAAEIARAKQ